MTIKEKMERIGVNPRAYFEEHRLKSGLNDQRSLEDMLCLFQSGLALYDADRFEELSRLILEHPDFQNNPEYQYHYNLTRALFFRMIGEMSRSFDSAQKAHKFSIVLDDPEYLGRTLSVLGSISCNTKDFQSAFFYLEEALNQIERMEDIALQGDIFNSFGVLLSSIGELPKARDAYEKAMDHYARIPEKENILNYMILLLNLGEVLHETGEKDNAEACFRKGIDIAEAQGFQKYLVRIIPLISDLLYSKSEYEQAYRFMKLYVDETEHHRTMLSKIDRYYDSDKLKEEVFSLNILRKRNEDLNNHLLSLYDRIEGLDDGNKGRENFFRSVAEAVGDDKMISYYQPRWSMRENRINGAEALVRWIKEDGTVISPNDFIGLIENSPLIHSLTTSVIRQAFSFCSEIRETLDPHFCISVNVSPYELQNNDIVSLIEKEMLLKGLYPENVEVEITERTFLDQNPRSMNQLFSLKELGVRIALDDFGTGYSSLSCLNRIPFNRVKVDRSLLLNASTVNKGDRMLRSIITLLHDMDFPVTVEGVEKEEHLELLRQFGCDEVQGYYYSPAVKAEEFIKLLRR